MNNQSLREWSYITLTENTTYTGITALMCSRRTKNLLQFPENCTYWFDNDSRKWYIQAPDEELADISRAIFLSQENQCIKWLKKNNGSNSSYSLFNPNIKLIKQTHVFPINSKHINKNMSRENNNLIYGNYSLKSKITEENITNCVGKYINPLINYLQDTNHGIITIDEASHTYLFNVEKHMQHNIVQYIKIAENLYLASRFLHNFEELMYNIKYDTNQTKPTYNHTSSGNLSEKIHKRLNNLNHYMIYHNIGYISYNNNTYIFATYPDLNTYILQYIKYMELESFYKQSLSIDYSITSYHSFRYKKDCKDNKINKHKHDDIEQRIGRLSSILDKSPKKYSEGSSGKVLPIFDIRQMLKINNSELSFPSKPQYDVNITKNNDNNSPKRSFPDNSIGCTTKKQKLGIDHNADFIPL